MFDLIKDFPQHLTDAIAIGKNAKLKFAKKNFSNVVVTGLGASGIGGNLVTEILSSELKVPVLVCRGYHLPNFVNEKTLLILSSYSGNTEETLSVATQAKKRKIFSVCVTSGGKLEEFAVRNKLPHIKIPSGNPPRTMLGYSVVQLMFILKNYGIISGKFLKLLQSTSALLQKEQKEIMQNAEQLASKLLKKVVIAHAEDKYKSTALRLKQQINENSKMHCWLNVFPELNHNELVGWRERNENIALLTFRSDDEFARNTHRMHFTGKVIQKISDNNFEVHAKGKNIFEKHFYLIHFGDWLSYYLAIQQGYDPMEIDVLVNLKEHMGKIK